MDETFVKLHEANVRFSSLSPTQKFCLLKQALETVCKFHLLLQTYLLQNFTFTNFTLENILRLITVNILPVSL